MSLYYMVASLPGLRLGDPPPCTPEDLVVQGEGLLSDRDLAALRAVAAGDLAAADVPFARAWGHAETQLRNAVAMARAERRREDAAPFLREHQGFDVSIEHAVADAFTKPNPLARERALDRCRWRLLDALTREEPFGLGTLLAYVIRLQIAQEWDAREEEAGRARLDDNLDHYIGESGLRAAAG
jgi:hypothetical protein